MPARCAGRAPAPARGRRPRERAPGGRPASGRGSCEARPESWSSLQNTILAGAGRFSQWFLQDAFGKGSQVRRNLVGELKNSAKDNFLYESRRFAMATAASPALVPPASGIEKTFYCGMEIAGNPYMKLRFDRGTILLENPEDRLAVAQLPGVLWDPRVRAFRAPAFQYHRLCGALERSAIRPLDDVAAPAPAAVTGPYGPVDLRPYQEAALDAWDICGRRGILVLPTGSGKTRVALAAMARTGLNTLCLVPTRVLLDQ